jgi:hypothetical protein
MNLVSLSQNLEAERAAAQQRRDELARQIAEASTALNARRAQLAGNEHWAVVDKLEHRMRALQQSNAQAQEVIELKTKDMDVKRVLVEVTNLLTELNSQSQKAALT